MIAFDEKTRKSITLNITDHVSISSLALKNFIVNHLNHNIPIVKGRVHDDIRESYYGGRVDVFKPRGSNLFYYDVNSLYPFAMMNDMPIGNPVFTTEKDLDKLFGFAHAKITAPTDLAIPILPVRIDGVFKNPLGNFDG